MSETPPVGSPHKPPVSQPTHAESPTRGESPIPPPDPKSSAPTNLKPSTVSNGEHDVTADTKRRSTRIKGGDLGKGKGSGNDTKQAVGTGSRTKR